MNSREKKRISSNKEKILKLLREAGDKGVLNTDLSKVSLRYGGIISNLHMYGYNIDNKLIGGGIYRYFLISEPKKETKPKKGLDIFVDYIKENHNGKMYYNEIEELLESLSLTIVRKSGTHSKNNKK